MVSFDSTGRRHCLAGQKAVIPTVGAPGEAVRDLVLTKRREGVDAGGAEGREKTG